MWCSEARHADRRPVQPQRTHGFTLLELMVVMVLLGLLAGLTLPALSRWYASLQSRSEATTVMETLRAQSFRAGAIRRDLRLTERSFDPKVQPAKEPDLALVPLPEGWTLRRVVNTTFRASGLCGDGLVALKSASGSDLLIVIRGPTCEFSWQPDLGARGESP